MGLLDLIADLREGDTIVLPERENNFTPDRRKTYTVGDKPNYFLVKDEDEVYQGYIKLPQVRLESFRARKQENSSGRVDLVTFTTFVVDDEEIGLVTTKGDEPLPPYTEERFKNWNDRKQRPHRIYGQNWGSDPELTFELLNHLKSLGWRARKGSRPNSNNNRRGGRQGGYQRITFDVFTARPPQPQAEPGEEINWREQWGTKVDAFEVTVNPDYENGFQSFVQGVLSNVERLNDAKGLSNPEERAAAMEMADRFQDSITGFTVGNDGQIWARHADIGMVVIGGQEFRIWDPGSTDEITLDDLMGDKATRLEPKEDADDDISLDDIKGSGKVETPF